VEEYGSAGEVTDDNIIGRMRIVCWVPKGIDTHSDYVIVLLFHASVITFIRTLRCLIESRR